MEYLFSRNFNGYIYTIDMLRLKTYITNSKDYEDTYRKLEFAKLKSWQGCGFGKFLNNYKVDSLWIGLDSPKRNDLKKDGNIFCLEFNPNKATDQDFLWLSYFINHFDFEISRFDLAIDIPRNINDILFTNKHKKCFSLFSVDYNNKTYYFGKGDGHTKIYNKKIESSLDHELTRYEITKECSINFHDPGDIDINFGFLEIAFTPYELTTEHRDSTIEAILYAVNSGYPFKDLTRHYKEIIKHNFFGAYDLNNEFANATLKDFISFLKSRHI